MFYDQAEQWFLGCWGCACWQLPGQICVSLTKFRVPRGPGVRAVFCFPWERNQTPSSAATCPQWRRIWRGGANVLNKTITVGKPLCRWSPYKCQLSMTSLGCINQQREGSLYWFHFLTEYSQYSTLGASAAAQGTSAGTGGEHSVMQSSHQLL